MDQNNYVAPYGSGWKVVVNGVQVGIYATQTEAEQAYNAATGASNTNSNTNAAYTQDGYGFDPAIWQALMSSNREEFEWGKEQFLKGLAEQQRQYDQSLAEQQRQFNIGNYSNLATSLLSGATSLRGPADWLKYAQYTSGGRDIFKALYGDQAVPAFSNPTGYSQAMSIQQLLADLGVPGVGAATGSGGSGSYNTAGGVKTIQQMRDELRGANYPGWERDSDQQIIDAYQRTTGSSVTPAQATQAQASQAAGLPTTAIGPSGIKGPVPTPYPGPLPKQPVGLPDMGGGVPGTTRDQYDKWLQQYPQYGEGRAPQANEPATPSYTPSAPLPYQINPAVWDSMSNTAKQMILAAAQEGHTPSGAWAAEDYLNQMYAARPKGTVSKSRFNWSQPKSYF